MLSKTQMHTNTLYTQRHIFKAQCASAAGAEPAVLNYAAAAKVPHS